MSVDICYKNILALILEPPKLSIAERVRLFDLSGGDPNPSSPSPTIPPVPPRSTRSAVKSFRRRGQDPRFQTQPITVDEVQEASKYRVSPRGGVGVVASRVQSFRYRSNDSISSEVKVEIGAQIESGLVLVRGHVDYTVEGSNLHDENIE